MLEVALLVSHFLLVFTLGYYLMSAMQWYSYRFKRVVFHFNKPLWHVFYFIIPSVCYYFLGIYFWLYFYFALLPSLYIWHKKLDKPLVFTSRIKRFFGFLFLAVIFEDLLCKISNQCSTLGIFLPLIVSMGASFLFEKVLFLDFKSKATSKLELMQGLQIIAITASYGKSSMKNFLYEILKEKFECYKSPRSVNTLAGLIKDVNEELPEKTKIYIAEAGARQRGDILEITQFLQPDIAVVGEVGAQHLEYFKTLQNVRDTKMELLQSPKLKRAFVHKSANAHPDEKTQIYANDIKSIDASLECTKFVMKIDGKDEEFITPILGSFSASNLALCVHVARYLGVELEYIKQKISSLKSVDHRLQMIKANGKVILDDSFNGNFEGMRASYELANTYEGRKVLLTPGIVESTKEENEKLALVMNDIFDVVVITSRLNSEILLKTLKKPKVLILKDKTKMEEFLAKNTTSGDLILFSNDAPSFI